MILGRPWALVLLLVPPILLWLRLRAARPRDSEASSLLVWNRVAPADAAPTKPRPPLAAWLEAAGAALLALGVADLAIQGPGASSVRVLVDSSPSMEGRAVPAIPGPVEETPDPERVLPGLLASGTPVVVVTDRRLPAFPDDPPRLQVVGVGRPGFDAGITAASGAPLPDGRWRLFLTIEAHGAPGPVQGTLAIDGARESITLTPGTPLEVVRESPARPSEAAIGFPGDPFAPDDRVSLAPRGGEPVRALAAGALRESPLARALAAAGAELSAKVGMGLDEHLVIDLVPTAGSKGTALALRVPQEASGPEVAGAKVAASDHPLVGDVRVDPASTLGRRPATGGFVKIPRERRTEGAAPLEAKVLLSDETGPALLFWDRTSAAPPEVEFLFLPGGTWVERDPSFVVLAKNLVDHAAGGPARLEAAGVLDPGETRQAAEGESFGDLAAALDAARRPDPGTRHPIASILLLGGAALLLAAWFASR